MLNQRRLQAGLPVGDFGREFRFHRKIGSTNDEAARLARGGAPEGALVVAEEQTAGRGRAGHRWSTPPGTALAMSVVLRPVSPAAVTGGGLMAVGALAVADALEAEGARPQIKWPNDVLAEGRKLAGVLVEASWVGADIDFAICGIGVNVRRGAVPPERDIDYPATCVEAVLGRSVDREDLLIAILSGLDRWYHRLGSPELLQAWEQRLAFADDEVTVRSGEGTEIRGRVRGLAQDGRLRLETAEGAIVLVGADGSYLRPVRPISH
ncbi:MAG: biotin--[acetyl-CoA-carboxylase] ligase [Chloroflexota bacterium]